MSTGVRGDQAERDRQYSPSSRVRDAAAELERYGARSARARARLTVHRDLPCGPLPEQRCDLFPAAGSGAPLFVFVHGGYWQELSKDEAAFAAEDFVAAGISFAALGYGLAPRYPLRAIAAMTAGSVRHLHRHLAQLPGAPGSLHLGGHSAGAHLVAHTLLDQEGWAADGRHARTAIGSATLLSGVYDLEPLRHTYVNDALGMDAAEARDCSPAARPAGALPPLVVARGEEETEAFAWQQAEFVARARGAGGRVEDLVVPGRHHFDLPLDLADPGTGLGARVLALVRGEDRTEVPG